MIPDLLKAQLELYGEQSGELEQWVVPHAEAMACRKVEQMLDFGLWLLKRIKRENTCWSADVENGVCDFSWEESDAFSARYRQWKAMSDTILRLVEVCERMGYSIEQADHFRKAYCDVSLMALDTENTKDSIESLEAGRGIRHADAINELRSRMGRCDVR